MRLALITFLYLVTWGYFQVFRGPMWPATPLSTEMLDSTMFQALKALNRSFLVRFPRTSHMHRLGGAITRLSYRYSPACFLMPLRSQTGAVTALIAFDDAAPRVLLARPAPWWAGVVQFPAPHRPASHWIPLQTRVSGFSPKRSPIGPSSTALHMKHPIESWGYSA